MSGKERTYKNWWEELSSDEQAKHPSPDEIYRQLVEPVIRKRAVNPCSYFGCGEEICEHDKDYPPPSMCFCQKHSDEIRSYVEAGDAKKIMAFWIKANGGPQRLADTF